MVGTEVCRRRTWQLWWSPVASLDVVLLVAIFGETSAAAATKRELPPLHAAEPLKEKMPWYHTSDELHSELQSLSQSCQGAEVEMTTRSKLNSASAAGTEVALDVLQFRKTSTTMRTKALIVFGEHARELVSPESALALVRALCGQGRPELSGTVGQVLDHVELTIVPNANPLGRRQVEQGFYCKRTNEDGVDLNRNWGDEHRGEADRFRGDEMDPGASGFSEPETQILRDLVQEVRPDLYLSVHSGAYLLGAPYGYSSSDKPENSDTMVKLLQPISAKYCQGNCPYGGLAELIGYRSMGCDIDYVTDNLGTKFAYTWEIYVGSGIRSRYVALARQRTQADGDGFAESFLENSLSFMQRSTGKSLRGGLASHTNRTRYKTSHQARMAAAETAGVRAALRRSDAYFERPEHQQDPLQCIDQFIPRTEEETSAILDKWTGAYLDICIAVDQHEHGNEGNSGA